MAMKRKRDSGGADLRTGTDCVNGQGTSRRKVLSVGMGAGAIGLLGATGLRGNSPGMGRPPSKHESFVFNVVDYGADPTGAKDSTRAIQAAIDAIDTTRGGTVLFPDGLYLVNGPLQTANGYNSRLTVPYLPVKSEPAEPDDRPQGITIQFQGETFPIIAEPESPHGEAPHVVGAVLLCTAPGSGQDPAILAGPGPAADASTAVFAVVRNLTFRESAPASHIACDFRMCISADVANSAADVHQSLASVTSAHPTAIAESGGFYFPLSATDGPPFANYAENNLDRCYVLGRGAAVQHGSHLDIDRLFTQFCFTALAVRNARHSVRAGRILSQRCKYDVYVMATAQPVPNLSIQLLDIERDPGDDIRVYDPNNLLGGQITFHDLSFGTDYIQATGASHLLLLNQVALGPFVSQPKATTSGTAIQNGRGVGITVVQAVELNPTSGQAATATPYLGATADSVTALPELSVPAGGPKGMKLTQTLFVPAGWWWRFDTVNATLHNHQFAAG